ncbi:TetR/AcrR family transcriptional regulator [Novosphingobium sp. TH158]|uniref:TetR/AcrR family transcriptional regulator n=1 Tax=Novosphingobium sp. TH158 TaxID=2067455 RepID=UPI0020B1709E|nr:TetR/AcrR family transcriptional regulator [Novosphingobium sp. TH158]
MPGTAAKPLRPMGQRGSANWLSMLEAAEEILREEGSRALTTRRVAEKLGVKQRLVYYYFKTMDDLVVEAFRKVAHREIERLELAVRSDHRLQELWKVCVYTLDPRLIAEFMALANRIEALREEVVDFIRTSRKLQVEALTSALARKPELTRIPPKALAILGSSAALSILRERDLGIDLGHEGTLAMIEGFLASADTGSNSM